MEEIIGLLIILAISIFKAVNKKLEKSGRQNKPVRPVTPAPGREAPAPAFDVKGWIAEAIKEAEAELGGKEEQEEAPAPIEVAPVMPTPVMPEAPVKRVAPVKPATPMVPVAPIEEKKQEKEKIDPKKLIIYSEIMTPKCMNNN